MLKLCLIRVRLVVFFHAASGLLNMRRELGKTLRLIAGWDVVHKKLFSPQFFLIHTTCIQNHYQWNDEEEKHQAGVHFMICVSFVSFGKLCGTSGKIVATPLQSR